MWVCENEEVRESGEEKTRRQRTELICLCVCQSLTLCLLAEFVMCNIYCVGCLSVCVLLSCVIILVYMAVFKFCVSHLMCAHAWPLELI